MKSDKLTLFITKLIKLTSKNELTWNESISNSSELPNGEIILDKVYTTILSEKTFQLYRYNSKYYRDEDEFDWIQRIRLNLVDHNGNVDYEFEYYNSLNDLYNIVREQNSGINKVIDEILGTLNYENASDLFSGIWRNEFIHPNGQKDHEDFTITEDNKYLINGEHSFNILGFEVNSDKVFFIKKGVKNNDNRTLKNELKITNENTLEGLEGGVKIKYTKQ